MPERVKWKEEGPDWNSDNVDQHPTNHFESTIQDENDGLETIDCSQHDQRSCRNRTISRSDQNDEVDDVGNRNGTVRIVKENKETRKVSSSASTKGKRSK